MHMQKSVVSKRHCHRQMDNDSGSGPDIIQKKRRTSLSRSRVTAGKNSGHTISISSGSGEEHANDDGDEGLTPEEIEDIIGGFVEYAVTKYMEEHGPKIIQGLIKGKDFEKSKKAKK